MPEREKKISKIIVKEQSGNPIQVMPQTKAEYVSYKSGTLKDGIDPLDMKDAKEMFTELDPHSETETTTETVLSTKYFVYPHTRYDSSICLSFGYFVDDNIYYDQIGWFGYYDSSTGNSWNAMGISTENVYYSQSGNLTGWIHFRNFALVNQNMQNPYDEMNCFMSNMDYYIDFPLQEGINYGSMYLAIEGFMLDSMENIDYYDDYQTIRSYPHYIYSISYAPNETVYEAWADEDRYDGYGTISISLPAQGETKSWMANVVYDYNVNSESVIPPSQRNMRISLTGLGNARYRLTFRWILEETGTVTTTTKWMNLKTTLVKNDDSTVETIKPFSGVVRSVDVRGSINVASGSTPTYPENNTFEGTLIIADGSSGSEMSPEMANNYNKIWPFRWNADVLKYDLYNVPVIGKWY